jgi:hypothetical protein
MDIYPYSQIKEHHPVNHQSSSVNSSIMFSHIKSMISSTTIVYIDPTKCEIKYMYRMYHYHYYILP